MTTPLRLGTEAPVRVRSAHRTMSKRQSSGFTLKELLVAMAVISLLGWLTYPAFQNAQLNGREVLCKHNLRRIGDAIQAYRQQHKGKTPRNLTDVSGLLNKDLQTKWMFSCPHTPPTFDRQKQRHFYQSYVYHPVANPSGKQAVCWDVAPHVRYGYFGARPRTRMVLYADGTVGTLPEEAFDRLNLRGTSIHLYDK